MKRIFLVLLSSVLLFSSYAQVQRFYDMQTGVGTPYVASTLEPDTLPADPETFIEPLIVNLDSVDCTTFVEYVTAARLAGQKEIVATDSLFLAKLQAIRYRHGKRGNYATRKHYFFEWISDAEQQGLLTDVTPRLQGSEPFKKAINFMSHHPQSYPQLAKSPALVEEIEKVENLLSAQQVSYIPKAKIHEAYTQLQHLDIVTFLTSIAGLDVQHVGFVWRPDPAKTPRLLHASSAKKQVIIDERTIEQYAMSQKTIIGIRVVRL